MHYEPAFPLAARPLLLLVVFLFCLGAFHVLFLQIWQLDKLGWKVVDYVWLGVAVVGLTGAAFQARHLIADKLVVGQRASVDEAYERLRSQADFFEKAVCSKFPENTYLPPLTKRAQFEADQACRIVRELHASLPPKPPINQQIQWPSPPPPFIAGNLTTIAMLEFLNRAKNDYERARESLREIEASKKRDHIEEVMSLVSPLFLALALALRITKVTGEILLGR